jgi:hypothetical protein
VAVIDENGGMIINRGKLQKLREKPAPKPLHPP